MSPEAPKPSKPSPTRHYGCLIIGGGHAGAQAAISLRQNKFTGSIGILTSEPDLPYERPPLSKDYLLGSKSIEEIGLRPPRFWVERAIDIHLGWHVDHLDGSAHEVGCADGTRLTYSRVIWATGGSPRTPGLAGTPAQGVHTIRTRADVDAIRTGLETVRSVAIIGGGFVGLETAAALRTLGKSVIVLEAANRLMGRVCGQAVSDFYLSIHRCEGVAIRLNTQVAGIETACDRVTAIRLGDGTRLEVQMALIGIGILPAVSPLLAAGATGEIGVDEYCRTSIPDVYAIGDCARHPNFHAGGRMIRLESVQNASDEAAAAAKTITGTPPPYRSLPWFWSKQYDPRRPPRTPPPVARSNSPT
jgi:3-phenylpropionate/trans-cinnamate dioxygenase ferredoxin reductase subunit